MTIAIGLMAQNGVVIGADSQMTTADFNKIDQGKVTHGARVGGPHGLGVWSITGAGETDQHIYRCMEDIARTYTQSLSDPIEDVDLTRNRYESTLRDFWRNHIDTLSSWQTRPDLQLLLATCRENQSPLLFRTTGTTVNRTFYDAIGSGQVKALSLLRTLYNVTKLDVVGAALLVSYVLMRVKETDGYCGNHSDIVAIFDGPNGKPRVHRFNRATTAEMEEHADEYGRVVERGMFQHIVCGEAAPDASEIAEKFSKITKRIAMNLGVRPLHQPTTHGPSISPP